MGVRADSDPEDTDLMFHRVGLCVGAMISEGQFERALFFCGTGMGIHIADAYLNAERGSGYEWWHNFHEFHKLAIDELDAFNYEEYKANGYKVNKLGLFVNSWGDILADVASLLCLKAFLLFREYSCSEAPIDPWQTFTVTVCFFVLYWEISPLEFEAQKSAPIKGCKFPG